MADDIARLGYEIDSSQAARAAKDLDKLDAASARVASGADGVTAAYTQQSKAAQIIAKASNQVKVSSNGITTAYNAQRMSAKQLRDTQKSLSSALTANNAAMGTASGRARTYGTQVAKANMHTANIAAQFNDIGVMMAAGQSPFLLAMQQGTQLNQVWTSLGEQGRTLRGVTSAMGAALRSMINPMSILTIGVIAGGAALVQWGMSALGASDDAKEFEEALKSIRDENKQLADELELTFTGFQTVEQLRLNREILNLRREEAGLVAEINNMRGPAAMAVNERKAALEDLREQIQEKQKELDLNIQLRNSQDVIKAGIEAAVGVQKNFSTWVQQSLDDYEELQLQISRATQAAAIPQTVRNSMVAHRDDMIAIFENAQDLKRELGDSAYEALRLAGVDMGSGISDASRAAAELASNLGISLNAAISLQNLRSSKQYGGRGGDPRKFMTPEGSEGGIGSDAQSLIERSLKGSGGVGGGGGQSQLDTFLQSLMTEREILEDWRVEQLELLNQYNERELAVIGGHAEAKFRIEQEYQERLANIQDQTYQRVTNAQQAAFSALQNFMGTLASQSEGAAKVVLAINTALSISQAIQNTAVAATRALAELGPVAGAVAAARIKAYGAVQVGLIAANAALKLGSSGGGGGAGGGSSQPSSVAGTTEQQPERIVRISVEGPDWARDFAENIATQLFEASKDGTRVIVER